MHKADTKKLTRDWLEGKDHPLVVWTDQKNFAYQQSGHFSSLSLI